MVGNVKEEFSDTVTKNVVISQSHASGTEVEERVTVDLVVSKGPEDVVIPDLTGNPKDRVVDKLTALGLNVELFEEYNEAAEGRAYASTPGFGSTVKVGSTVQVYMSKGPKPSTQQPATENQNQNNENTSGGNESAETGNGTENNNETQQTE